MPGWASPGWSPRRSSGRPRRGSRCWSGRCLDTAESALPYLPFTEIVGALAATRPELVAEHVALRHLSARRSGQRRPPTGEQRDLGQLQVFDAVLVGARRPHGHHARAAGGGGPALGRPLQPRSAGLPALPAHRPAARGARHLPHRRPAPAPPAAAACSRSWCGCPPSSGSIWRPLGPRRRSALVRLLADGSLAEPKLRRVARRSEGNAFFAEELVSASSDGCRTGSPRCCWPASKGSPPTTQRVLRIASVAGRRVRHGGSPRCPACPTTSWSRRCARPSPTTCWSRPTRAGRVDADDGYVFRHALLREAIYHELLPGERSRLHAQLRRAARAAGRHRPARPPSPAGPPSSPTTRWRATTCRSRWPRRCRPRRRPTTARRPPRCCCTRSGRIELWCAVPDAEAVAGVDEARLTRWAAWGASATGDPDRGIALGRRALELAEERGDPALTARIGHATRCGCWSSRAASRRPSPRPAARWSCSSASRRRPSSPGRTPALARVLHPDRPLPGGRVRGRDRARGGPAPAGRPGRRPRRRQGRRAGHPRRVRRSTAAIRSAPASCSPRRSRWPAVRQPGGRAAGALPLGISLLDEGRLAEAGDGVRRGRGTCRRHRHHVERLRARPAGRPRDRPVHARRVGCRRGGCRDRRRVGVGRRRQPARRGGPAHRGGAGPVRGRGAAARRS